MSFDKILAIAVGFVAVLLLWPERQTVRIRSHLDSDYDYIVGEFYHVFPE